MTKIQIPLLVCLAFFGAVAARSQTILWNGSGDGMSWSDPNNWAGQQVPGSANNVVITNGAGTNIVITSSVTVESIMCAPALTISSGSLTVTAGSSSVQGALTVSRNVTLSASGSGATFTSSGSVDVDGASLYVSGGAVLTLPRIGSYQPGCGGAYWEASGAGSVLSLPGLTNLVGPTCGGYGPFTIQAENGGQVLLTNLPVMDGSFSVLAQGSNSVVDLPQVQAFSGSVGGSQLLANNGGTILVGELGSLNGAIIPFDGSGTLNLSSVTNIDNTSLNVTAGAVLILPRIGSYQPGCGGAYWEASGAGSVLSLPGLTNLVGPTCGGYGPFTIQAENGGQVLLTNLPVMDGSFSVLAQGSNSVVDLPQVQAFSGSVGGSQLLANNGGTILVGELGSLNGAIIPFDGSGTLNLSSVTNIDNTSLNVTAGAVLILPRIGSYQPGCGGAYWEASGAGSVLSLPGLTNLVGPTCGGYGPFTIQAENGGQVLLTGLQAIGSGGIAFLSDGSASAINLTNLSAFIVQSGQGSLTAQNGGVILLNNQAFLLANVVINIPAGNPVLPPTLIASSTLTLYGIAGHSYRVEERNTLQPGSPWTTVLVPLTNSFEAFAAAPPANTAFLVMDFVANPAFLQLTPTSDNQLQLVLYGATNGTYQVESATKLRPPISWTSDGVITMTNAFHIFPEIPPVSAAQFYHLTQP